MKRNVLTLSVLLFTLAIQAQIAPVVISEVLYDTPLDEHWYADYFGGPYFNGEYIELFNPTETTVDISGWRLRDGDSFIGFIFPPGSRIAARSAILVAYRHPKSPSFSIRELFPDITPAQEQTSVYYHSDIRLTNDGDVLELLTDKQDLVDKLSWLSARGSKDPHMAYNWTLQAHNGEGIDPQKKLQSLQRTNIHASSSRIDFLQGDYERAEASPLRIPQQYDLPVLTAFYRSGHSDTSLPVGALPGEASVTPTGAATYRIPIKVPPGTNGWQPQLAIAYNSQGGAGVLGQGWDIAGLSVISRGTQSFYYDGSTLGASTVQFDERDRLYMDGQRLILISGTYWMAGSVYGFEQENQVRVTLKGSGANLYFEVAYPGGSVVEYGKSADSRVRNAADAQDTRTLAWKADKATDVHGNEIHYTYAGNGMYPSSVQYAGTQNKVTFTYSQNTKNARKRYHKDFLTEQSRLLRTVDVWCDGQKVRSYTFDYTTSDTDMRLESINEVIGGERLNATKIEWGEDVPMQDFNAGVCMDKGLADSGNAFLYTGDIDGDGHTDKIEVWTGSEYSEEFGYEAGYFRVILKDGRALPAVSIQSYTKNYPFFIPKLVVGDVNADGRDEIMLIEREELKIFCYDAEKKAMRTAQILQYEVPLKGNNWRTYKDFLYNAFLANANDDEYPDLVIIPYAAPNFETIALDAKGYSLIEVFYGGKEGLVKSSPQNIAATGSIWTCDKKRNVWGVPLWGDFDANGILDMLKISISPIDSTDNKLFRLFETTAWNEPLFWIQFPDGAANHMPRFSRIYPVDYDGDGLTDLLVQGTKDYNYEWYFLKNTGGAFNAPIKVYVDLHRSIDRYDDELSDVFFLDYNGDGLLDIVVADETFVKEKKEKKFTHHDFLFYKNVNGSFVKEGFSYRTDKRVMKMRPVVMDADGDGVADLVFTDGVSYTAIGKPGLYRRNLVHKITNGLGQIHAFTYQTYSDYDQSATTDPVRNLNNAQ